MIISLDDFKLKIDSYMSGDEAGDENFIDNVLDNLRISKDLSKIQFDFENVDYSENSIDDNYIENTMYEFLHKNKTNIDEDEDEMEIDIIYELEFIKEFGSKGKKRRKLVSLSKRW